MRNETYRGFKIPTIESLQLVPGVNVPMITLSKESKIITLPLSVEDVANLHNMDPETANDKLYEESVKAIDAVWKKENE